MELQWVAACGPRSCPKAAFDRKLVSQAIVTMFGTLEYVSQFCSLSRNESIIDAPNLATAPHRLTLSM
jgi:hypothetical protein